MSWSSTLRLNAAAGALATALALAGCSSFAPVYGDHGAINRQLAFSYDKPVTRLDQVIYEDLALRLGRTDIDGLSRISVKTSTDNTDLTLSDLRNPTDQRQATVTAVVTVTSPAGKVIYTASRSATAVYTVDGQGLSDISARRDAEERAAHELAETLRLTLLGALASAG